MLGIIGYFALSALQSGDESSIGVTLAKQITGLYPISRLFMSYYNFPMYYGMGFYIVLSIVVFYLFVKIASLKYGLLNTLANTKSSYANDKVSYERKSVFFLVSKRAWTIFKFLYGSLECWAWSDSFMCL